MKKKMTFKNKKAAMSILEAFIAISLIMIIVVILLEQDTSKKENTPERVYSAEIGILRNLQINETYRADILNATVPVYWNETLFPSKIKEEIERKKPAYLDCRAKICEVNQPCSIEEYIKKDVYAQSAFISANITVYSPRELKLFCWER